MAMREVCDRMLFPLNPNERQEFSKTIPLTFLESESDQNRILESWNNLLVATNALTRKRRGIRNRYTEKAVFEAGMERLCDDFSRRTENIKVNFIKKVQRRVTSDDGVPKMSYSLDVIKLLPIPEHIRNPVGPTFTAEVPPQYLYQEQQAEYVGEEAVTAPTAAATATAPPAAFDRNAIPTASAQIVRDVSASSPASSFSSTSASIHVISDNEANVPILAPLVTLLPPETTIDEPQQQQQPVPSALERMQELESIKSFLTESEYATKRQEILDSI